MYRQILSTFLGGAYCLLTLSTICAAAEKVVVIPMGNSLFKGDQYHTISNAAFAANSSETPWTRPLFIYTSGYLALKAPLTGATASVNLPDGATISQLSTYIGESGLNCKMTFAKHTLSDHQLHVIDDTTDSINISTAQYGPIHVDIANEIIDNQNYQYHLSWACTGLGTNADSLYAVRIKYRLQ